MPLLAALVLWLYPLATQADVFIVDDPSDTRDDDPNDHQCLTSAGTCSLRAAVQQANHEEAIGNAGPHIVGIRVPVATLGIPGYGGDDVGDLNVSTQLIVTSDGKARSTIDGNGIHRIFQVEEAWSLELVEVDLVNGHAPERECNIDPTTGKIIEVCWEEDKGGGIYARPGSTVQLIGASVSKCTAEHGGGIFAGGAFVRLLSDSAVFANLADRDGGGLFVSFSDVRISRSEIWWNEAGRDGGGIYEVLGATLQITDGTRLAENLADRGAGLYAELGAWLISQPVEISGVDTEVKGNSAGSAGGGAYFVTRDAFIGRAQVVLNSAPTAGGIYASDSELELDHADLVFNTAQWTGGGGMMILDSRLEARHVSFDGNRAPAGGGLLAGHSTAFLEGARFSRNQALSGGGGAILLDNDSRVTAGEGCKFVENSAATDGGAIELRSSTATISDAAFESNVAGRDGGALMVGAGPTGSTVEIARSYFIFHSAENGAVIRNDGWAEMEDGVAMLGNNALIRGGAVYNTGVLVATGCEIGGNRAGVTGGGVHNQPGTNLSLVDTVVRWNDAGYGGGIFNSGAAYVSSTRTCGLWSRIEENTAEIYGGGIANVGDGAFVTIADAVVAGNVAATGHGGGVFNGPNAPTPPALNIFQTDVHGNTASLGGGLALLSGPVQVVRSSILENQALSGGGGVFSIAASLDLVNSTLSNNFSASATSGAGGVHVEGMSDVQLYNMTVTGNQGFVGGILVGWPGAVLTATTSIVDGNLDQTGNGSDCSGAVTSGGFNVMRQTAGCPHDPASDHDAPAGLGPRQSEACSPGQSVPGTTVFPLSGGSPAIDAGDPGVCNGSDPNLSSDQLFQPRVGTCDIGAFELP